MKRVLLSALLAATTLQASAGIIKNGSFESGLLDWPTIPISLDYANYAVAIPGSVIDETTKDGVKSAGLFAPFVPGTGNSGSNVTALADFVGVSVADLRAKKSPTTGSGYTPDFKYGSAIQQTFTVAGADTLQFYWNFLTNETGINDFSFYVLNGKVKVLADTGTDDPGGTVFPQVKPDAPLDYLKATGWTLETVRLDAAGTYTLSFAALQGAKNSLDSLLLVDNVRLASDSGTPIPEPVSLGLVGLGLLAFGCNRRRKA